MAGNEDNADNAMSAGNAARKVKGEKRLRGHGLKLQASVLKVT